MTSPTSQTCRIPAAKHLAADGGETAAIQPYMALEYLEGCRNASHAEPTKQDDLAYFERDAADWRALHPAASSPA